MEVTFGGSERNPEESALRPRWTEHTTSNSCVRTSLKHIGMCVRLLVSPLRMRGPCFQFWWKESGYIMALMHFVLHYSLLSAVFSYLQWLCWRTITFTKWREPECVKCKVKSNI